MHTHGTVLFGDVIGSRERPHAATDRLAALCHELDATYGERRLAAFEFTQGDEIQGLIRPDADPFEAILRSTLPAPDAPSDAPRMRWVAVQGAIDPGRGPATHRTGAAFIAARTLLTQARNDSDGLLCQTGDTIADEYLSGTAPVLSAIIDHMTDRQRRIAHLALVEGLRQSEIAERLAVARPTVSVSFARGDIRSLTRLAGAVRAIWRDGAGRARADAPAAASR